MNLIFENFRMPVGKIVFKSIYVTNNRYTTCRHVCVCTYIYIYVITSRSVIFKMRNISDHFVGKSKHKILDSIHVF